MHSNEPTDVSVEHVSWIFTVKEKAKQETSIKQTAHCFGMANYASICTYYDSKRINYGVCSYRENGFILIILPCSMSICWSTVRPFTTDLYPLSFLSPSLKIARDTGHKMPGVLALTSEVYWNAFYDRDVHFAVVYGQDVLPSLTRPYRYGYLYGLN